jgi:hypothetical protein
MVLKGIIIVIIIIIMTVKSINCPMVNQELRKRCLLYFDFGTKAQVKGQFHIQIALTPWKKEVPIH